MTLFTDAQTLITEARTFAADSFDDAAKLVSDAQTAARGYFSLGTPSIAYEITDLDKSIVADNLPGTFTDSFASPDASGIEAPTFEPLYIPEIPAFPTAPDALDTTGLFTQAKPDYDLTAFDEEAPEIDTNITLPTEPSLSFPDAPESDASALTAPKIATPTFDQEFSGVNPGAVGDVKGQFQLSYDDLSPVMREAIDSFADDYLTRVNPDYHNQLSALEAKIAAGVDGGKGLTDEYEQRVFDRARSRIEAQGLAAQRELADAHARRGFVIPPGAMMGGNIMVSHQTIRGVSEAAATTAIDRATRELQHAQFAMQLSTGIRQAMVNASLSYMGNLVQINSQALDYAHKTAEHMVNAYNAALALYEADRQLYEAEARVFQTRLEAAFAELRSFEAQLSAIRSQTEVEALEVQKYTQLIAGERAKIDLYLAQIEGVSKQNDLKRLKLEIFSEKVRAYLGKVQAKGAEFDAYKAALSGDEARVRAYSEQVRSYSAGVDAIRSQVQAETEHSRAISDHNRNLVQQLEANIRKYEAELRAEGQRFDSSVEANKAALDRYKTVLNAQLKLVDTELSQDRLRLDAERARHRGEIDVQTTNGNLFMQHLGLMAQTATGGANVLGSLASSALSAQNTMVTLSATES